MFLFDYQVALEVAEEDGEFCQCPLNKELRMPEFKMGYINHFWDYNEKTKQFELYCILCELFVSEVRVKLDTN